MPHLTKETDRLVKQSDLTSGGSFRKITSFFLLAIEAFLLAYSILFQCISRAHVIHYAIMFVIALSDLYVTDRCSKNPVKYADLYSKWSLVFGLMLLSWAISINLLETRAGRPFVTFVTIVIICVMGVRTVPKVSTPALVVCFSINGALMRSQLGFNLETVFNYLCLLIVILYAAFHVHDSRVAEVLAQQAESDKSAQLEQANKQLSELNVSLERTAATDTLTGAGNRQRANQVIQELWEARLPFTIAFIDLDNLKYCNDTFGHTAGDNYLTYTCFFLQELCTEDEQVFRIGGDEFLLLSPTASESELCARLEEARNRMLQSSDAYRRSFSYGCVHMSPDTRESYSTLLSRADKRMYRYKMKHSSRWEFQDTPGVTQDGEIDKSGLDSRIFEVLSITASRRYLYLTNMKTNIARWSRNAIQDFDLPGEYMYDAGNLWLKLVHPDDREMYTRDIDDVLSGRKRRHSLDYRVMNREGHYVRCSCEGYVLKGDNNEPDYFAGTITNHGIVDNIDPVTNLYNTYEFMNSLRINYAERKCMGFLCIGIDQFHTINNTLGYSCGNQVLEQFAQKLQSLVHGRGYAYRLDGVKFAMSIEDAGESDLRTIYEHIIDIARNEIVVGNTNLSLSISGGALHFEHVDQSDSVILSELYYALACSKRERSGELVYYDDQLHSETRDQIMLLDDVKRSILENCRGFYMVYQPQVDREGCIVGVEALLRWHNEAGDMVSPDLFVPVLENDSCFYELGSWILETVLHETKPLLARHPELMVSVNVSYQQLNHRGFRDDLLAALNKAEFPAGNLTLELTEHCGALNTEALMQDLQLFRSKGIGISADDFGTGFSCLSGLRDLPFSCLKVDQGFVRDLHQSERNRTLVETIIACAKKFHISTCVEGVENRDIFESLLPYEAEYYQGYLFSEPIVLAELLQLLERKQLP